MQSLDLISFNYLCSMQVAISINNNTIVYFNMNHQAFCLYTPTLTDNIILILSNYTCNISRKHKQYFVFIKELRKTKNLPIKHELTYLKFTLRVCLSVCKDHGICFHNKCATNHEFT